MTSTAKIEANRRNAQQSTGPRTAEGKAASSRNALRHGLASQQLILFDETEEAFEQFHGELRAAHAPVDAAEAALVERIAVAHWRLRRVWRAEAATINGEARAARRRQVRAAMARAIAVELEAKPPEGPEGKLMSPQEAARLGEARFACCRTSRSTKPSARTRRRGGSRRPASPRSPSGRSA
jgi:hypothetical protein